MGAGTVVLVILIVLFVAALPLWPYSSKWGYAPGGVLSALMVVLLLLMMLGAL